MKKAALHYRISAPDPHTHLFHVELEIASPSAQQQLSLPVWIPGSYLIREFAKHLQGVQAHQGKHACAVQQLDKHRWQVDCTSGKPLRISYQVYAYDNSVRTAWLDADRGFFNATSLCLMAEGQTDAPHHITIDAPNKDWQLATGLDAVKANKQGFGTYSAPDYDTLADCPVEMGAFWSADFEACGVPHRFVIAHPLPTLDGARLLEDTRHICEAAMRFWHGSKPGKKQVPFDRYVFMLNAVDDSYGGLEHANSTALIASRKHLPRMGEEPGADYVTLLGLISHEYFHAWNVKRLKPASFLPYDYARENYTELLWFFEGLTSYYDDLLLLRAGCIDLNGYLRQLQKT
ncbi:MAG: peptidase M61, partial [Brachymonas sp.]|nr:peptidase M61 [Brachymonas sp.]